MSFGSYSSDRPSKSEVCDFVGELRSLFFEKDIFWFDISVDEIFLVDTLEPLHDFDYDSDRLFEGEYFSW